MKIEITRTKAPKGQMARRLVYFCIGVLTVTAIWSMVLKTIGIMNDTSVDLSDALTFIGAAFGGELLMLLAKRLFAKEESQNDV